jgi:hypothetical protein
MRALFITGTLWYKEAKEKERKKTQGKLLQVQYPIVYR